MTQREIPVEYPEDRKPQIVTTTKQVLTVIGSLLAIIVIVLGAYGWLLKSTFEASMEQRFSAMELRLAREYALRGDTLSKIEYELRHKELIEADRVLNDRIAGVERRMENFNDRVLHLERK